MAALVLRVEGRAARVFEISGPALMIGRIEGAGWLSLSDSSVSLSHARLEVGADGYVLEDLGSEGGVFVNGRRISRASLEHGDAIQIGRYALSFFEDSGPAAHLEGEPLSSMPRYEVAPQLQSDAPAPGWQISLLPLGGPPPIVVIREPDQPDRRFALSQEDTIVGRGEEADLQLPHASISRFHARLSRADGDTTCFDLGSRNPLRWNGRPTRVATLCTGDVLRLGRYELVYYGPKLAGAARARLLQLPRFSSPARPWRGAAARLVSLVDGDARLLDQARLTLGDGADIPARGWYTFGAVAEILQRGDGHVLRRRRLTSPVRLNLQRIREAPLRTGDLIEIGRSRFRYLVG